MNVRASPPHHLTKSRLCMVLLEATENVQSHVTFIAICADVSSSDVQNKFDIWWKRLASEVYWPPLGKIL
jgi:hypothetical protein